MLREHRLVELFNILNLSIKRSDHQLIIMNITMDNTVSESMRSVANKLPLLISKLNKYYKSCPDTKPNIRVYESTSCLESLVINELINPLLSKIYDSSLDQIQRVAVIMNLLRRNGYPELTGIHQEHYANLKRDLADLHKAAGKSNLANVYLLESLYITSAVENKIAIDKVSLNRVETKNEQCL